MRKIIHNKNSSAKPIEQKRKEEKLAWINKWCVPANAIVTCSHPSIRAAQSFFISVGYYGRGTWWVEYSNKYKTMVCWLWPGSLNLTILLKKQVNLHHLKVWYAPSKFAPGCWEFITFNTIIKEVGSKWLWAKKCCSNKLMKLSPPM